MSESANRRTKLDRFSWGLAAITTAALALRVWYALRVPGWSGGDEGFYHQQANLLSYGHWFVHPYVYLFRGELLPSALHPPLWPAVLGAVSELGFRSFEAHRVVGCLVGAGTVAVIGLAGRQIAGRAAGLVCAGVAAVYPNLWIGDGLLELTTVYALFVSLIVLFTYRWLDRPRRRTAIALGAVVGMAALTRAEGLLLVALLVPVFLLAKDLPRRTRLAAAGTVALTALVVVAPWVIVNVFRYERPVLISTSGEVVIGAANCARAYDGSHAGAYATQCFKQPIA